MKQTFRSTSVGIGTTLVPSMFAALSSGCGGIDANGFLGLETCDILNCDGLFFGNLVGDHDDDDDHTDDADDHTDDADGHDDGDDDHIDDLNDDDDDDVEESEDQTHG